MVFNHVIRVRAQTRERAVTKQRTRPATCVWCALAILCVVAYIAGCAYVYNLSRERHRLVVLRKSLVEKNGLLRMQREALGSPVRIQSLAQAAGMVRLGQPMAPASASTVVAKRD